MASTPAPLLTASSKITGISYYGSQLYYTSGSCMYSYSGGVRTVIAGMSSLSAQTADGAYPTTTPLVTTMAVCTDLNGNKYIVDKSSSNSSNSVIVKMPSFMPLQTDLTYNLVGTNTKGTFENNQLAYSEKFKAIKGMCYDSIGNLYVCDASQNIVARMGVTGIMSVYAGTLDTSGSTGDGAAATSARLNSPSDIKMSRGNILYIADTGNNRIRRVKMSGTIDTLIFTGSAILSPRCLAFDNSENLYVVGGSSGNIIYRISNFGISATVYTQETPVITITSITVDKATNNLYFCTANTVYRIMSEPGVQHVLNGLTAANGLAVDTANNLFVSDSSTNRVFKMPLSVINIDVNTLTPHIGNGDQEPEFSITGGVAPNIYGNAGPPKTRALTSPGAIIVNPSQGILVAQPTKITLLATASSESLPLCANKISQISIRNNSTLDTMYLSQIVALNSSGVNVLLRSANVSYVDGTYACKSKDTAYAIVPKMTLNIPVTPGDDIVVVLLYPSSTLKSNWNGATIRTTPFSAGATNNVVRIIQGISESVTLKNFVIDYRTKSATCAPYINFVNKYKLQSNSAPPTETSYREKWVRYVRISPAATTGTPQIGGLKRVYVIDGETGEDRIVGKLPNVSINIMNSGSDTTYGVQSTRNTNLIQLTTSGNEITGFPSKNGNTAYFNSVTISDVWLEYDLMDEYPIERVILDQGSGSTSLKVSFFTSSRVLVQNPTASITFSGPTPSYTSSWSPSPLVLTPVVTTTTRGTRYIRVVNGSIPTYTQATLTLSGSLPPTGLTNLVADSAGNVYAVNTQAVYKIAGQTGAITLLFDTGSATTSGLGVDSTGNVYIADSGNHLVRKRGLDGTITTLVGTNMSSTLMVAGGFGGSSIAWSDNGKSWNASQNGNSILPLCNAVAYNGSMWVAGGNGSTIAWSNDGKIWNASINGNTMFGQQFCYAIAWNGSMWVAGGNGAGIADKTSLAYSYDGKNWNKSVNGHMIFSICRALAWNGSMWVAGGAIAAQAGSSSIAWSNDGINWNASTNGPAIFNNRCYSVAWGESLWVAGGSEVYTGGNSLAWSDDGKTWYGSTSGNTIFTSICYAVAYNGSIWVAGGSGTNTLAWSSDGKTWYASTNGNSLFPTRCNTVVWNGSIWIAGGGGTNMLAWSDDGKTWYASTNGNSMFSTECFAVTSNRALSYAPGFVDGSALSYAPGFVDAKGTTARFNSPRGIVVDANGMIYVADTGNNAIRMINPYGITRTLVSSGLTTPRGVAIDGSTNTLYITDSNAVRTITGNTDLYTAYTLFSGLTPSSPVSTTTNLQVLLRAKNYSGTGSWPDESGNNKSATMAVGGVNQKNSAGNGIVLNGSTYWTFPALPTVANAWTANVWYKQTGANVGSVPAILTQQYIGNDLNISIRANGSNIFGGWIFKYNPHNYYYSNQNTTLQLGVWTNIQITWNGSSMVTYVNGIQTGTTAISLSSALGANTQMFNIGKRWDTNESGNDYVRGEIGEVRVYNRALTAIEVQAAYIESSPDFSNPQSTCIDPSTGDLYIADTRTIHKLTGITSTFPANTMTGTAQTLPIGTPATNGPYALTVTPKGTLITANGINGKLKSYTATSSVLDYTVGKVTTVAGDGSTGQLNGPSAVAVDSNGNIFIADTENQCIRMVTPGGAVSIIAGTSGTSGYSDTAPVRFNRPFGIVVDSKGNVYVSDRNNNRIRKLTNSSGTWTVSTFAGSGVTGSGTQASGGAQFADGDGATAKFNLQLGICIDSNDNIYVADNWNFRIRMITPAGVVSTIAGNNTQAHADGIGASASFIAVNGIAVDSNFNLYVSDQNNNRIRKITPSSAGWTVSTLAGSGAANSFADGTGTAAGFSGAWAVSVDSSNNVYVADAGNHRIRKITPGGIVTTLAGSGSAAFADGIGVGASFNTPRGMCIDKSNNLYIADTSNNRIRKIAIDSANDLTNVRLPLTDSALVPIGTVTTPSATIYAAPLFPIFDTLGNMYFAGWTAHAIYKVTPTGLETRIAGSSGTPNVQSGFVDANGDAARFANPIGIAIDSNNNIFVADFSNHRIRRIDSANNVTTVAGSGVAGAWGDGLGTAAQLNNPVGLAFDSLGNLFFSEHGTSHRIRMMAPNGAVTTIAGNGTGGNTNGIGTAATFHSPTGLAFDSFGNLYIADQTNHCIRMITAASVRTTNGGVVSTFAGGSGPQWIDAVGAFAAFKNPCGICIDVNNNIYVGEQENRRIRMITPGAVVTTIAGNSERLAVLDSASMVAEKATKTAAAKEASRLAGVAYLNYDQNGGTTFAAQLNSARTNRNAAVRHAVLGGTGLTAMPAVAEAAVEAAIWAALEAEGLWKEAAALLAAAAVAREDAAAQRNTYQIYAAAGAVYAALAAGFLNLAEAQETTATQREADAATKAAAAWAHQEPTLLTAQASVRSHILNISTDGLGLSADFYNPYGVTIDPTGQFLYVGGNTGASTIRRITIGSIIGWGITTYLGNIVSPVVDNNGCTYMATQGQMNGYYIYKTTPGGFTYPIAGWNSTGTPVYTNSSNFANMICYKKINGLAVTPSGDVYVAETGNHCIRVLKPSMGSYAIWTYVGNKMALQGAAPVNLNAPRNVAIDPDYNLYVLDDGNSCIRKISANGSTSTFSTGVSSYGITYDKVSGLLFITERVNHCVSSIHPITGVKTVIAGTSGTSGSTDGITARFNTPDGIAVDTQGNLYVVDKGNNTIRRLTKSGTTWTTTTIVGSASGGSVNQDGIGTEARLWGPSYIAVATNGDIYVTCDSGEYTAASRSRCIKKITSGSWVVSTYFTFTGGITGNAGNNLRGFGITVDSSNNLFVSAAGSNGHYIYRITNVEDGYVIAGNTTTLGDGYSGGIDLPLGLCVDPYGNIFVAAMSNHAIRILVPRYMSSVLAGNGAPAFQDGAGLAARFNGPNSIALDRSGNIIVADTGNNRIRKVTPAGIVTTIGGTGAATSTGDAGLATAATFNAPTSVSTDWFGVIYITENSSKIRALYPNYNVSLLAGSNSGFADGVGSAASFNTPTQIAWDNTNKVLWVADTGNNAARTVTPSGLVKSYLSYPNGINGITVDPSGLTYVISAGTTIGKYTPTRPPFTIGQLVAVDSNGINVAYKKPVTALSNKQLAFRAVSGSDANPYTSASTSSTEYLEVDLQQDCEITQVTCVNNTGSGVASGTQVIMYDAAFRQQDSRTMSGGSTQTVDFRYAVSGAPVISGTTMKFAPLLLTDSSKYVPDTTLAGYIRGQYIVLENNSTANKTITPPVLYDIYGKKLGTGITSPDSTALTTYGSKWEYDLGEECYIRDIENTNNASIVIYNRLQAEVWRNYITTTITAPFPTQIPITSSAFTYPIRFVRISEAVTLKHVSVIDNRGIDVAVWKMVRKVSGTTVTFQAFNGLYNSDNNIVVTGGATDRIEIDLGLAYNITNIQIYHTGTTPNLTVTTYGATGAQILGVPSSYIGSTNTLTTYKANGLRTRYISVSAPSSTATINNLVIVDSLGRNVFLQYNDGNSGTYAGMSSLLKDTTAPVSKALGKQSTTRSGNTVEFDLGREYNILYLVVYNNYTGTISTTLNPTVGTTLTGTTIQFSDAYRNVMANRTIMGNMGVTYPIGNPITNTYFTPTDSAIGVTPGTPPTWSFSFTEKVVSTYTTETEAIYGITGYASGNNMIIFFTTNTQVCKWSAGTRTVLWTVADGGLRGIALSVNTNTLYVCNSFTGTIGSVSSAGGSWTTIAGGGNRNRGHGCGLNSIDGNMTRTATQCTFNNPTGIAIGSNGVLYVADTNNHLIRKLEWNGTVWTVSTYAGGTYCKGVAGENGGDRYWIIAGPAGGDCAEGRNKSGYDWDAAGHWCNVNINYRDIVIVPGSTDGQGSNARFNSPSGISMGSDGKLYVADITNNSIRVIDSSRNVSTALSVTNPNYVIEKSGTVYVSRSTSQLSVRSGSSLNTWADYGSNYRGSGTTETTDGYIEKSAPADVAVTWSWPGIATSEIESGLPGIGANSQGYIGNIGQVIILGNVIIFVEIFNNTTYKIRRIYNNNTRRVTNYNPPLQSATGSNTYTYSGQNYFIPNSPFVGPFTQANAASAVVSNTFIAQITTEVIDVSMPPPVTGLYFVSITSTSISIGWLSGGGSGTSYIFTLNGAPVTPVLTALTATFNSLTPDTVLYEIGVYTSNTNGSSFPATITSYPNTTAPVLSVLSATSTSITVQWTGGDFTNYYTYTLDSQSLNPTVDNSKINKTATFTRTATNSLLVGNTEYRIVVISNRNTGTNFPSTALIVKTAPVVPLLSFGTINQTLSWSGGDGATSYRILRNEVDMTSLVTIDSVAKTILFTNALGNTVYTFILTAINTNGSSESDPLTITTGPAAPVLIIAGITATGVTVSWTGADGASSFRFILYLKKSSDTAYVNAFGKIQGVNVVNGGGNLDVNAIAFSPTNAAQPPVFLAQDGTNVRAVSAGATPNARYFVGTVADFRYDYYIAASASSPYSGDVGTTLVAHTSFTTPYPTIIQTGSSITITNMISNSKYTVGVVGINTNGEQSASVDVTTGGTFSAAYSIPTTTIPSNITSTSSSEITQSAFKITYVGGDRATSLTITITSSGAAVSGGYGSLYTYNVFSKQLIFFGLNSSNTYTISIQATNSAGMSNTFTANVTTLGITVTIKPPLTTINSATIQWDPVPTATFYKYTVSSEQTTTSTGPLTISGLTAGTSYTLTVNAFNVSNSQIGTGTITFLTAPPAPTGLSQSSSTYAPTSITVTWSSPPSTSLYPTTGYVFTVNGSPVTPTLSGNSAIFNNILPGSSNIITMKYSSTGDTATVTAYTSPAQLAITPSSITNITTNSFTITWASSAGATSYRVYYQPSGGNYQSIEVNPSPAPTLTVTISSLLPNKSYNLYVRATANNIINESNTIPVLTRPEAPTGLNLSNYTMSYGCKISWTGNAASYTITGFGSTITGITNNWYDITGQPAGTTYSVTVIAVNNTASVASAAISVLMLPGPITSTTVSSITQGGFTISWLLPTGATSYEYSTNAGSNWILNGAANTVTISGQTPDSSNSITILLRARNVSGVSTNFSTTVLLLPRTPTAVTSNWTLDNFEVSYTGGGETHWKVIGNGTDVSGWITATPYTASYPGLTDFTTNTFMVSVITKNASGESPTSASVTEYKPPMNFTLKTEFATERTGYFFAGLVLEPAPMFATKVMIWPTNTETNNTAKWNFSFSINPPDGSDINPYIPFVNTDSFMVSRPPPSFGTVYDPGHSWYRASAYNPRDVRRHFSQPPPGDLYALVYRGNNNSTKSFNILTGNKI